MANLNTTTRRVIDTYDFELLLRGKNVAESLEKYVRRIECRDNIAGESDELEVELEDIDGRWRDTWYPAKGDSIHARIGITGQKLLDCGDFEIDQIRFTGPPTVVVIRALSTGVRKSVRTREGKYFENKTLPQIVASIAARNRLTVVGKIKPIHIDYVTQFMERDVEFLARLADQYGYAFKINGKKLIFFERQALRDATPLATLRETDLAEYNLRDQIRDVEHRVDSLGYDINGRKVRSYQHDNNPPANEPGDHTSADTLRIAMRPGTPAMMKSRGAAALARRNDDKTGGDLKLKGGDQRLVSGACFMLTDMGKLSGKYLIDRAVHTIERGRGYTCRLEIKRVAVPEKGNHD